MTTSTDTTFVGAKGGVGTTTVAVLHALQAVRAGRRIRLTGTDSAGVDDLAAVLGVSAPEPGEVVEAAPGLTIADHRHPEGDNVVDGGTDCFSDHHGRVFVVLRNDYLSLRRALRAPQTTVRAVLVIESKRALGRRDVEDVLSYPVVAELNVDPTIARAVDAGLMTRVRVPRELALPTEAVATPMTPPEPGLMSATGTPGSLSEAQILARYKEWLADRKRLSAMDDNGQTPDPDDWHASDDEAVDLLLQAAAILGRDRSFTQGEVDSIYVHPDERYVVSLIVGYADEAKEESGVDSPQRAAAAALELTRDTGSSDTHWCVYDRDTSEMHHFEQSEFSYLEVD